MPIRYSSQYSRKADEVRAKVKLGSSREKSLVNDIKFLTEQIFDYN